MANMMSKLKDYLFPDTDSYEDDFYAEDIQEHAPEIRRVEEEVVEPVLMKKNTKATGSGAPNLTSINGSVTSLKMVIFEPLSYDDSATIIDNLKAKKPVIVNMVDLPKSEAQRILDFMSGAAYAVNGSMRRISLGVFVIVPSNIGLVSNNDDEEKELLK